ncbi:hypothetical protein [Streptomyces beijiangensis]|uniref:Integral membrane protein n=1 Tax=Streptomyces beijiangensis TaxID=163361 RepID=A0A939JGQ7_9ACTN|nr:hypothetical protein [Streptomyces beijiangensis]MBO0510754.1 hypothetical protein [Streptomyces beijiangensis]
MAGTEEVTDESLYVLTALLLTPAQFPSVLGDDFPAACAALGIDPHTDGYGLVLGQGEDGARWTVVVDDVSLVAVAIASWDCGIDYDLSPDERTVVASLPGWPLDVAVAAPGIPEPHDPDEDSPLTPPDTGQWGPAQRRLGADEIAQQWAVWREQLGGDEAFAPSEVTQEKPTGPAARVIEELRGYVASPPPPGRVRSTYAPDGARTVRTDGPGWSMVARTDDIAFLLLDEAPGEVVPLGRGTELPALLKALEALAVRPA